MSFRAADLLLDESVVAAVVTEQFSELAASEVVWLGSGWDNDVFIVDQVWAFRFPKRAERVAWQDRELDVLGLAAEAVGPIVPRIEYRGEPSRGFPYPFIGYRLLNGRAADQHLKPSSKLPEQLVGLPETFDRKLGVGGE